GVGPPRRDRRQPVLLTTNDVRMHQGVQFFQPLRTVKNLHGQGAAVDMAIGSQNLRPELPHYIIVCFGPRQQDFMAELIGRKNSTAQFREGVGDVGFPGREAAGEADFQHVPRRRRAALTVLTMSMAMVRGPTPPGTGVYAPAHSAMSAGCTSPTSTDPFWRNSSTLAATEPKIRFTSAALSSRLVP